MYTAAGQDPTSTLTAKILALAPGKEQEASDELNQFMKEEDTQCIVVKGAHLCQSWLGTLPSKL